MTILLSFLISPKPRTFLEPIFLAIGLNLDEKPEDKNEEAPQEKPQEKKEEETPKDEDKESEMLLLRDILVYKEGEDAANA